MTSRRLRNALRTVAALSLASAAASCSSEGNGDWKDLWTTVYGSFSDSNAGISVEQASAIPYATLGVRVGSGPQQILILATDNGLERVWTSAAHVAIATRKGRIIRTSGLLGDLSGHVMQNGDRTPWAATHAFSWSADFEDLGHYSIQINCQDTAAGPETITILGKQLNTTRINETCSAEQLDWQFTNIYWIDPVTERVWKSSQHVYPGADPVELEILRPPQTAG